MRKIIKYGLYGAAFVLVAGAVGHFDTDPLAPISDAFQPLVLAGTLAGIGWLIDEEEVIDVTDRCEIEYPVMHIRRYPENPYTKYRRI